MGAAIKYATTALGADKVLVFGSFRPQTASALVDADTAPAKTGQRGFSVAYTSTGLNTVTFSKKYTDMEACFVSARKADGTAIVCQAGDYDATAKTLQIRTLVDGGGTALARAIQLPITAARAVTMTRTVSVDAGGLQVGSTPPTLDTTCGGWCYDADAEASYVFWRVPDDWVAGTSITARFIWHAKAGTAVASTETVIWKFTYRTITRYTASPGQTVDHNSAIAGTATYTQSGSGTDKECIATEYTIAYNATNQNLAAGCMVAGIIQRDKTNDTYADDVILMRVEFSYTASLANLTEANSLTDGPYLTRVNGATDPSWRIVWPAGDTTALQLPCWTWPADTDATTTATVNLRAMMSGATDTPTLTLTFHEGLSDTNAGSATAALGSTDAEKYITVAAADIDGHPKTCNVTIVPGTHATDAVYLHAAWVEYTSTNSPAGLSLTNLSDDVDNRISFLCIFKDATTGGAAT